MFVSLTFLLISCMKLSASDAASAGECWDSWVYIWYLNCCAFNHLYTINNFASSDLARKIRHRSDAFLDTTHVVATIPCWRSLNTYLTRTSSRGTNKQWQPKCFFLMLDDMQLDMWSNCFSINDSICCWCQMATKLHPMKQKMLGSFQLLQSVHAYISGWNFFFDPIYHRH